MPTLNQHVGGRDHPAVGRPQHGRVIAGAEEQLTADSWANSWMASHCLAADGGHGGRDGSDQAELA